MAGMTLSEGKRQVKSQSLCIFPSASLKLGKEK